MILLIGLALDLILLAAFGGVILSIWAYAFVGIARHNNRHTRLPTEFRIDCNAIRRTGLIAIAIAATCLLLSWWAADRFNNWLTANKHSHLSQRNLRAIASTLEVYYIDHGVPADSLKRLIDVGHLHPNTFIEPIDRGAAATGTGFYSSYAYFPVTGHLSSSVECQDIIIAFATESRYPTSSGLRRGWSRTVVFSDAETVLLDAAQFKAALAKDLKARRALGWPVYLWDQTTQTVSRAPDP